MRESHFLLPMCTQLCGLATRDYEGPSIREVQRVLLNIEMAARDAEDLLFGGDVGGQPPPDQGPTPLSRRSALDEPSD